MPTLDIFVRAHAPEDLAYEQSRLRYAPGDVVDWLPATDDPRRYGKDPVNSTDWRIIRVTGLEPEEANMLCSHDAKSDADVGQGVLARRRLWTLSEDLLKPRDQARATVYDLKLTRDELFKNAVMRDEEKRSPIDGKPIP